MMIPKVVCFFYFVSLISQCGSVSECYSECDENWQGCLAEGTIARVVCNVAKTYCENRCKYRMDRTLAVKENKRNLSCEEKCQHNLNGCDQKRGIVISKRSSCVRNYFDCYNHCQSALPW